MVPGAAAAAAVGPAGPATVRNVVSLLPFLPSMRGYSIPNDGSQMFFSPQRAAGTHPPRPAVWRRNSTSVVSAQKTGPGVRRHPFFDLSATQLEPARAGQWVLEVGPPGHDKLSAR